MIFQKIRFDKSQRVASDSLVTNHRQTIPAHKANKTNANNQLLQQYNNQLTHLDEQSDHSSVLVLVPQMAVQRVGGGRGRVQLILDALAGGEERERVQKISTF